MGSVTKFAAIGLGTAALSVGGVSFLVSHNNYERYSKDYEAKKTELLANTPQYPKEVVKDNEYVTYDDAAARSVPTPDNHSAEAPHTEQSPRN